jgi:DNA-binding transcriptional MocR family regulator
MMLRCGLIRIKTNNWAMSNWAPDLTRFDGPRYQALVAAIGRSIERGELKPGERLPARRDLARALGLSVNTVSSAYAEAGRRGLVSGEVGRGTYVMPPPPEGEARFFMEGRPSGLVDLSICRPCIDPMHTERLRAAFAGLAESDDWSAMLACRPVIGLEGHRRAASAWLAGQGVEAPPDRIVATNGCAHALTVALATLVEPGDGVATEALTDHGIISLASVLHFRLVGLEMDGDGIRPDAFEAACRSGEIKVLVTTPTLNNPTTQLMPEDRRRRIAAIARTHGVAVVEDDVFRPLVADPPPPICAFLPERGWYVTSFTKSAMSGLRTGYLVPPAGDLMRAVARVRTTSWMATPLAAEISARWIADGTMEELVAWQRRELAWRQHLAESLLGNYRCGRHPTGINLWVELPGHWRAVGFVEHARQAGVAVTGPDPFLVGRTPPPHAVRVSVGAAQTRAQLERGLQLLREVLARTAEPVAIEI